jgi:hypothetical protein
LKFFDWKYIFHGIEVVSGTERTLRNSYIDIYLILFMVAKGGCGNEKHKAQYFIFVVVVVIKRPN